MYVLERLEGYVVPKDHSYVVAINSDKDELIKLVDNITNIINCNNGSLILETDDDYIEYGIYWVD